MSKNDVRIRGWNDNVVKKAVASILKYSNKQVESSEDGRDEIIYLQLSVFSMPTEGPKEAHAKPIRLLHPLYDYKDKDVCLISRDYKDPSQKEMKKKLDEIAKTGNVKKIITLPKLRSNYAAPEAKKKLCKDFEVFFVEDKILPQISKVLNGVLSKVHPIPINLFRQKWTTAVEKGCRSTYLQKGVGTSYSLKIGRSSFSNDLLEENLYAAIVKVVSDMPKKWANVRGVYIKTAESVALPVFQRGRKSDK